MSNPMEKFLMPYFLLKCTMYGFIETGKVLLPRTRTMFYVAMCVRKKRVRSTVIGIDIGDRYPNGRRQIFCMPMMTLGTVNSITWNRVISDFFFSHWLTGLSRCKHSLSGIFEGIEYSLRNEEKPFLLHILSIVVDGHLLRLSAMVSGRVQILTRFTHTYTQS